MKLNQSRDETYDTGRVGMQHPEINWPSIAGMRTVLDSFEILNLASV